MKKEIYKTIKLMQTAQELLDSAMKKMSYNPNCPLNATVEKENKCMTCQAGLKFGECDNCRHNKELKSHYVKKNLTFREWMWREFPNGFGAGGLAATETVEMAWNAAQENKK